MIVIADASPLSALAEIGELDLLRQLFRQVVIPETVYQECTHQRAPGDLATRLASPGSWFVVLPDPVLLPETHSVDPGEAAAISLAWLHRHDSVLIIDDKGGRKLCETLGLRKTGTAGVLFAAARAGLVDFEQAIKRLQTTSFRLSPSVVEGLRLRLAQG